MSEIVYKSTFIPVVRIDSGRYKVQLSQAKLPSSISPRVYLYYKGTYYPYDKPYHLNFFIHFVNRHLYPVVILKDKQQVEKFIEKSESGDFEGKFTHFHIHFLSRGFTYFLTFMNTSIEWTENTPLYNKIYRPIKEMFKQLEKITRVIAFVGHKSEYSYELKTLNKVAKELGFRDDLRIAKVTDLELIKYYKFDKQYKWFESDSLNSIVVFSKGENPIQFYDLSTESKDIFNWINMASIDKVENMTVQSLQIMENMNMPLFLAFIDREHSKYGPQSISLLNSLKDLKSQYPHYLFGFFENHKFDYLKPKIDIDWEELPALGLYNPPPEGNVTYPRSAPITDTNLRVFFERAVNSVVKDEPFKLPEQSYNLSRHLRYTTELNASNYKACI